MIDRRSLLTLSVALASLPTLALSGEGARGSRVEAKSMADAALNHIAKVGFDTALKDFSTDSVHWTDRDLYVVVFDFQGVCLAHGANPKLIGKQMLEIKDQTGRYFVKELIASAQKAPEGWVDFDWVHPQTKRPEPKTMNARRVPGKDAVLAVGYYR
jgi:cytochrome c